MTPAADAIADLPFTHAKLGVPTRLWVVQPTKDWAADNETGRRYAESLLNCIREHEMSSLLGQVVKAMKQSDTGWTGIEVGFFHRLAERSI